MRVLTAAALTVFLSTFALAQFTPATTTLPRTVYEQSAGFIDAAGNLVVIDHGVYFQSTTLPLIGGTTRSEPSGTPKTRITVVRPSTTEVMEYDGKIEVLAVGTKAIYGVIVEIPGGFGTAPRQQRSLVALMTQSILPASVAGFPSVPLDTNAALRASGQDTFTLVDPPRVSGRSGRVIAYNGTAFVTTTVASLP